jgi:flagellar motor switch/type III secretory pathway protein FliN
MQRPPETGRQGLALLLRPSQGAAMRAAKSAADAARSRSAAQALARRLSEIFLDLYGVRAGFAFDVGASAHEPGPGLVARLIDAAGVARLAMGQSAIYDLVEALFGGDGQAAPYREERAPTELEQAIVSGLAPLFSEALGDVLERPSISFERMEKADEPALAADLVALPLKMRLVGRDSRLAVHCPRDWLGLDDVPVVAAREPDISQVSLDLKVSLLDRGRPLGELLGLTEGSVLPLHISAGEQAVVESDGVELFRASLGQSGGRYTIRIDRADAGAGSGSLP